MQFGTIRIRTLTTSLSLTQTFLSLLLGETGQATFMFFQERPEVSAGYLYSIDRSVEPQTGLGRPPRSQLARTPASTL